MLKFSKHIESALRLQRETNVAVIDGDRRTTYSQLRDDCRRFANGLLESGLEQGDRVAIHARECYETAVAVYGTATAGGVFVPVNRVLRPRQVQHIIDDCTPRFFVANDDVLRHLASHINDFRSKLTLVSLDSNKGIDNEPVASEYWQQWRDVMPLLRTNAEGGESLCAIVYTSGSTGLPKGIMLSHNNLIAGAASVNEYLQTTEFDRLVTALPWSFDAGLSQLTTAFSTGASIVCHNYLLPRDLLSAMRNYRVTGITAVPSLWAQLAKQSDVEPLQDVRYFANTGGALAPRLRQELEKLFPNAEPFLMYGFTEAFRGTYLEPSEVHRRPTSIGRAIPNADIAVVTAEGLSAGIDEPGELVQSGPHVALGYWNNPAATASKFRPLPATGDTSSAEDRCAWSGDIVRRDAEGFLYFIGRSDEMIKTSGYRVSPEEIESVARQSPLVADVVAIGVPCETLGSRITLVWSPTSREDMNEEPLRAFLARNLPGYMVPSLFLPLHAMPLNANGKPDRVALRQLVATMPSVDQ